MPGTTTLFMEKLVLKESASFVLDKFLEGLLELVVEDRVDHRVDKRVEIAEPGEEVKQHWVKPAILTDTYDQCCYEEGQPADDKGS